MKLLTMHNPKALLIFALFLLSGLALAVSAEAPVPTQPLTEKSADKQQRNQDNLKTRGQLLYENHCIACHESSLHIRDRRKARSIAEINQWVTRWVNYQKLDWTTQEIQQVADFLNQEYYHYQQ